MEHRDATGRTDGALLPGCEHVPADEEPNEQYQLLYTTGRTVFSSTPAPRPVARGPRRPLRRTPGSSCPWRAPSGSVSRRARGAGGVPRGAVEARARVGQVVEGAVFAPFHYGSWPLEGLAPADQARSADELTRTVAGGADVPTSPPAPGCWTAASRRSLALHPASGGHAAEVDVLDNCELLAPMSERARAPARAIAERYRRNRHVTMSRSPSA